jgi:hypothetical protein
MTGIADVLGLALHPLRRVRCFAAIRLDESGLGKPAGSRYGCEVLILCWKFGG